ncbi:FAD-dependent oxidoreductase [Rubrivirga sp. S365]|uniref:FAD-dependent oxidoreductase n=1 Tax=Rubrivirga sp. S365 TaxID=3076080 RepID=UPI0028C9EC3A|nr:FAD-dependent oxidoreductase [Rubrivirga sp. S365]MDT7855406.1 FAD-dependent oxidoreductase [Rubrivirga sp. S365]
MDAAPFPTLTDAQLDRLRAVGHERAVEPGDLLFREGDDAYDFFVVLSGAVEVFEDPACERPLSPEPLGPGHFLGEIGLLLGEAVYATARVDEGGVVLEVPAERFRELVGSDTDLAETVLDAFTARRGIVSASGSGLQIVGSQTNPDAVRLAEFARRNYLPYRWLDPEDAPDEAAEVLAEHGRSVEDLDEGGPLVFWGSETTLDNPTLLELADAVGIGREPPPDSVSDLVIVGAGPAGLAAAVYGASEGLSTVLMDEIGAGGQASWSSRIENYLGFPSGITGTELATRATLQAHKFGARFVTPHRADALRRDGDGYAVSFAEGGAVRARVVVLATGANYRRLPIPNLRQFEGAGVYYAATELEAPSCRDRTAVVVGGGNSAGQAAMFLSERTERVLLAVRGGDLSASMSQYLADRVEASDRIEVRLHTEVVGLCGDGASNGREALGGVDLEDTEAGTREHVETPGLFVFIGVEPCTD